jgi:serine/threonine protein phosphatase PrpC
MSEPFKIRVGSKSNKGTLKSENDDRILIGMDPAANDWLFSPDPVQVGEFGTVLLLADGLGDNENGGSAAQSICKTIKKLFDETLELPPSDEEKMRLLIKFFQIAQKQLHTYNLEHQAHKNIGASATLVLLLENKAFIVWLGNCRVYRYNSKEVGKSFFSDMPNLELLTVDHTFETEKVLFDGYREEKYLYPNGISKYVSTEISSSDISMTVVSLRKRDRILICSEGLFSALADENIQDILSSSEDPEIAADVLISRAFNNGAEKNISAIVTDILEVETGIPVIENPDIPDIAKARLLYGTPIASEVLPPVTIDIPKKEKTISLEEDLVPVKLRTVMPEPELNSPVEDQTPKNDEDPEIDTQAEGQISLEWPIDEHPGQIDLPSENEATEEDYQDEFENETENPDLQDEEAVDSTVTPLMPEVPQSQIQGEMAERLARLKIKMTVYPDPEDKASESTEKSPTESISLLTPNKDDENARHISINSDEDMEEEADLVETEKIPEPFEEDIFEDIIIHENDDEEDTEIEEEPDQEEPVEIPEPFESAILPLSEEFVIDLEEDSEVEHDVEHSDDSEEELYEEPEDKIDEEEEDVEEKYGQEEEIELELEPVIPVEAVATKNVVDEIPVSGIVHSGVSVQKPIAHLIGADKDNNSPETSEKKSKLWPYFVVLGFLILIPIWICKDNSALNSDSNLDGASAALSTGEENPSNPSADIVPLDTLSEQVSEPEPEPEVIEEDETEIVNPPKSVVPDPETEKPKEKKKEETKPKSDSRQPKYDAEIEKNKHQLLGEVQALLQQKNQLCKQISTYGKNAPESKSESIKQVQNKCAQLGQKFSSIYDLKSGYFKTVRYDFMKGTIKSIRVSMDQIDQQFKTIRGE